jgi:hypothetical protein
MTARDALAAILREGPLAWDAVGCDARSFLDAARAEELCALIHRRQRDAPECATWPVEVRRALEDETRAAVARELLIQRELLRVLEALERHAVRPLLFKGTALAYTHYPQPSLRPRCDTDLLIRETDRGAAQEALAPLGYAPSVLCDGDILFRQFELVRDDQFGVSHALDVHWAISTQAAFAGVLTYQEMWPRALPAPALGPHARVPSTVDALMLALIHPAMHHQNAARLLWTYDVHLLAGALKPGDLEDLVRRATEKGIAAVCAHGLRTARDGLGTALPQRVLDALDAVAAQGEPTAAYLRAGRSWAQDTAASLRALTRWRDRLRLLREIALPSPGYMLRAYRVADTSLGRTLLPALYLHRGVRGVLRVVSGRK